MSGTEPTHNGRSTMRTDPVNTFPILERGIGVDGAGTASTPGGSLTRTVQQAIRDALGWRPRAEDPRGFRSALATSFTITPYEGRTLVRHVPRALLTSMRSDLGAVTGAQASIALRGKAAVDSCLPVLDRLTPLRSDADAEDAAAARVLVRTALLDLAAELGNPNGPRQQKVDTLFTRLVGSDQLSGLLDRVHDVFGLSPARVNTIGEEEVVTSFQLLCDYVHDLRSAWENFVSGKSAWFGPVLLRVSRLLAVVTEQVDEVEMLIDSVYLGSDERAIIEIEDNLDLAGLLDWIRTFASKEAPVLLQDAGKAAAESLCPTVLQLAFLTGCLLHKLDGDTERFLLRITDLGLDESLIVVDRDERARMPEGMKTTRVHRAIDELHHYLALVKHELCEISAPDPCGGPCRDDAEQALNPVLVSTQQYVVAAVDPSDEKPTGSRGRGRSGGQTPNE